MVVRPVVSDHAGDPGDAVGGEEGLHVAPQLQQRGGFLIGQGLRVGEAGESVDRGIEVAIAGLLSWSCFAPLP